VLDVTCGASSTGYLAASFRDAEQGRPAQSSTPRRCRRLSGVRNLVRYFGYIGAQSCPFRRLLVPEPRPRRSARWRSALCPEGCCIVRRGDGVRAGQLRPRWGARLATELAESGEWLIRDYSQGRTPDPTQVVREVLNRSPRRWLLIITPPHEAGVGRKSASPDSERLPEPSDGAGSANAPDYGHERHSNNERTIDGQILRWGASR